MASLDTNKLTLPRQKPPPLSLRYAVIAFSQDTVAQSWHTHYSSD